MYVQTVAAYGASFFYAGVITQFEVRYLFASIQRLSSVAWSLSAVLSVTPYPNVGIAFTARLFLANQPRLRLTRAYFRFNTMGIMGHYSY
jgi:Holliday junction resolvase-like predicted endonuclease